jgi:hypothetical protein
MNTRTQPRPDSFTLKGAALSAQPFFEDEPRAVNLKVSDEVQTARIEPG